MALRITASNARATAPSPWAGGDFTIAFWVKRFATTARPLAALYQSANSDVTGPRIQCQTNNFSLNNGSSSVSDSSTQTWTQTDWTLFTFVVSGAIGGQPVRGEFWVNAVGTGSPWGPAGTSYDFSTLGFPDVFQLGANSAAHSNGDFAHVAYFDSALTQSQITELMTKAPDSITGATPVLYYPLISDTANHGSGGSTYDLTLLSGAVLNSANDSTIPAQPASGVSTTISATTAPAVASITGEVAPAAAQGTIAATTSPAVASVTGSAASTNNDIRLSIGIQTERGGPYQATGWRYTVFADDARTAVEQSGTVDTSAVGLAVIDINASPNWVQGDWVPVMMTQYNAALPAADRVIRTMFGFVQAQAQS